MKRRHERMLHEIDGLIAQVIADGLNDAQMKHVVQDYLQEEVVVNDMWAIVNDAVLRESKRRVNKKKSAAVADDQRKFPFAKENEDV